MSARGEGRSWGRVSHATVRVEFWGDEVDELRYFSAASAELDDVARALVNSAYTRVELVEKRGEFALRGGLLDVFPPTEPHLGKVSIRRPGRKQRSASAVASASRSPAVT